MSKKQRRQSNLESQVCRALHNHQGQLVRGFVIAQELPLKHRKRLREEFKDFAKDEFYKRLAQEQPEALSYVGFERHQIDSIAVNGMRNAKLGKFPKTFRQFNVDHVEGLINNDFENLTLMQVSLNELKNKLEAKTKTKKSNSSETLIETIRPIQIAGKYLNFVAPPKHKKSRQFQRMARDLGPHLQPFNR